MDNTTKDVFEAIADLSRLSTDLIAHEAITLDHAIETSEKRTRRIKAGDMVRVMNNYLAGQIIVDCSPMFPATHAITECRGTIYQTLFEVDGRDLETNEVITIKL